MRVATYNIRNGRAPDLASLWWLRRRALAAVVQRNDADVWGLQEVYGFQRRYLERRVLRAPEWAGVGDGRTAQGGEQVPVHHRADRFREVESATRWFGDTPDTPGSRMVGATMPRIATHVQLDAPEGRVEVVNLHLDHESADRRAASIGQVVEGLGAGPTIVMGDFNATMTDPGFDRLRDHGLSSALPADAGPTANGFGRDLAGQRQIDHIFVSTHFRVETAWIDHAAGHASDHYPVVADLAWR